MYVHEVTDQKWVAPHITRNHHVYHRFNSSIVHLSDNLFVVCYRCFVPDIKYLDRRIKTSAHVWNHGWDYKLEQPIITLVNITQNWGFGGVVIKTLKELTLKGKDGTIDGILNDYRIEDCRVWKHNGKIFISGSLADWYDRGGEALHHVLTEDTDIRRCLNDDCFSVMQFMGELDISTSEQLLGSKHVCLKNMWFPCVHHKHTYVLSPLGVMEKNWVYWSREKRLFVSYSVTPHVVFETISGRRGDLSSVNCDKVSSTKSALDDVKTYKGVKLVFRGGSNAIKLQSGEFMAVGHSVLSDTRIPGSQGRRHELEKTYLMFFYTFDADPPHKLNRVSDSFLPLSDYNVVFPCGVTNAPGGGFLVSYGEGDVDNNILHITTKDLNRVLYKVADLKTRKYELHEGIL